MELGAFSISIPVTDLARSRAYYEAFGFEVVGGNEDEQWLILRNDAIVIGLFSFEGMDFSEPMLTFNPGLGQDMSEPDSFTDIREIRRRLLDAGVAIDTDLDPDERGPASLGLHDPDGHPILIDQFRDAPA
jgi:catechol 2,3-dioxygenase-like lactoylglutathione lyase family enzyme